MKTLVKWVVSIAAIVAIILGFIVFSFLHEMKAEPKKEEKVISEGKQYIKNKFDQNVSITGAFYDNMGNFNFDYAAKAHDKQNDLDFLVYYNEETEQTEDTYIAEKWTKETEDKLSSVVHKTFPKIDEWSVYYDDNVGFVYNVSPTSKKTYTDYDVQPVINIKVPRKVSEKDPERLEALLSYAKDNLGMQHATFVLEYSKKGVPLEDEILRKEF
jgi:hypothetical protein